MLRHLAFFVFTSAVFSLHLPRAGRDATDTASLATLTKRTNISSSSTQDQIFGQSCASLSTPSSAHNSSSLISQTLMNPSNALETLFEEEYFSSTRHIRTPSFDLTSHSPSGRLYTYTLCWIGDIEAIVYEFRKSTHGPAAEEGWQRRTLSHDGGQRSGKEIYEGDDDVRVRFTLSLSDIGTHYGEGGLSFYRQDWDPIATS